MSVVIMIEMSVSMVSVRVASVWQEVTRTVSALKVQATQMTSSVTSAVGKQPPDPVGPVLTSTDRA